MDIFQNESTLLKHVGNKLIHLNPVDNIQNSDQEHVQETTGHLWWNDATKIISLVIKR